MKKKQKQPQPGPYVMPEFSEQVGQLLTLDEPDDAWLDYSELGLSVADAEELTHLAMNEEIWDEGDEIECFAVVHAWRALVQLKVEDAVSVLLTALLIFDSDWACEEIPEAIGHIGPSAIAPVKVFLADDANLGPVHNLEGPRITASCALESIAKRHREARAECVAALVEQLKLHAVNPPELNGFLVYGLVNLNAAEELPIIDQAFSVGNVDPMIIGDLKDVRRMFGLLPAGEKPKPKLLGTKQSFISYR